MKTFLMLSLTCGILLTASCSKEEQPAPSSSRQAASAANNPPNTPVDYRYPHGRPPVERRACDVPDHR